MSRILMAALAVLAADGPFDPLCPVCRWHHSGPCHPADR